jgi:hypothetical protein
MSIADYIAFHNGQRTHAVLNYKTTVAFEMEVYSQVA